MKYLSIPFLLGILVFSFGPIPAQAHTEESDGDISAILHVEPNHKPTAGDPATINFYMSDAKGTFDPASYEYTLMVTGENGTSTIPVVIDGTTLKADHVFPKEGDYGAELIGSSTASGKPSFDLVYDDITVYPSEKHENHFLGMLGEHGGHFLIIVILTLILAGVYVWDRFVTRRFKKKS